MNASLGGARALVTGGTRGIGNATVHALAAAGAHVVFTGRDAAGVMAASVKAASVAAAGAGVAALALPPVGVAADVADADAMADLFACHGPFDIVVNNAAVIDPIGAFAEIGGGDFARALDVNVLASFRLLQHAVRGMGERGGTIVNLSSGAAHRAVAGWAAYCTGKAALKMLTACVALEHGPRGIRCFGFSPGGVDTDMQVHIRESGVGPLSQRPRSALAPPAHPAQAIVFLCTPAADSYAGSEIDIREPEFRARAGLPPL